MRNHNEDVLREADVLLREFVFGEARFQNDAVLLGGAAIFA